MKYRVPRKVKKWHRKHNWQLHYTKNGTAYWIRDYGPLKLTS